MSKKLSDQQKLFLEVLFDQAEGDLVEAKRLAGYSETYPTSQVVKVLKDEILEATKDYLSRNGPKAAIRMVGVMDNPIALGVKEVLAAAKEVLDRGGVVKTERVELGGNGIFILPAKRGEEDGEEA